MLIKLLCISTIRINNSYYGGKDFVIKEGDIVNALIDRDGVRFEYEPNHYSVPYRFEDVDNDFISAFDEDTYNKIYKKATNCKAYFNDGQSLELGNVTIKMD